MCPVSVAPSAAMVSVPDRSNAMTAISFPEMVVPPPAGPNRACPVPLRRSSLGCSLPLLPDPLPCRFSHAAAMDFSKAASSAIPTIPALVAVSARHPAPALPAPPHGVPRNPRPLRLLQESRSAAMAFWMPASSAKLASRVVPRGTHAIHRSASVSCSLPFLPRRSPLSRPRRPFAATAFWMQVSSAKSVPPALPAGTARTCVSASCCPG